MLDDLKRIKRVDVQNVRGVLEAFPAQCRAATRLEPRPLLTLARPRVVILAGMGGSAASGDLLAACGEARIDVPIIVHRGYGLPRLADERALLIASSYSGQTAEVLSAVGAALEQRVPVAVVTAGGALAELAHERRLPLVTLPGGLMPRMALGYLLFPALGLLRAVDLEVATVPEVDEAFDVLSSLVSHAVPECPTAQNEAKRLAIATGHRLPVIYGSAATGAVAYRWKTDLAENAKVFALTGALPEMNHNDIEAWASARATDAHLVLLRDYDEGAEVARRFAIVRELVAERAGAVSETWSRGAGRLARLLSLVYLGQWTSYYLAVLNEVDPWSIPLLDEVKRRMRGDRDRGGG